MASLIEPKGLGTVKYRNLLTIGLFFLSAGLMNSQTSNPTRPDRGFYPNGSFAAGEFDTINNVNGNVIARVPITNLAPGRGGSQFGVNLTYNSAIYDTTGVVNTAIPSGFPVVEQRLKQSEHGGWQLGYQYGLEYETRASSGGVCNTANQPVYKVHKMSLRTPDGSLHTLRLHDGKAADDDIGDTQTVEFTSERNQIGVGRDAGYFPCRIRFAVHNVQASLVAKRNTPLGWPRP